MKRSRWKQWIKNSYRIALMGTCGVVVSSSVIVANAEKAGMTKQYQQSVPMTQKYYMNYGFEEVLLSYQNMIEDSTASSEEFLQVAEELLNAGESDKAVELLQKALQIYPDEVDLYLKMTAVYELLGDFEKAEEYRQLGFEKTGSSDLEKKEEEKAGGSVKVEPNKKLQALIPQMLEESSVQVNHEVIPQGNANASNGDSQVNNNQSQTAGMPEETPEGQPDQPSAQKPAPESASASKPTPAPEPEQASESRPEPEQASESKPEPEQASESRPEPEPTPAPEPETRPEPEQASESRPEPEQASESRPAPEQASEE